MHIAGMVTAPTGSRAAQTPFLLSAVEEKPRPLGGQDPSPGQDTGCPLGLWLQGTRLSDQRSGRLHLQVSPVTAVHAGGSVLSLELKPQGQRLKDMGTGSKTFAGISRGKPGGFTPCPPLDSRTY